MSFSNLQVLRPKPQRPFRYNYNALPDEPATPDSAAFPSEFSEPPSRSQSIRNLTSSTLGGIYCPTDYDSDEEETSSTPVSARRRNFWGAESPDDAPIELQERPPLSRTTSLPSASNLSILLSLVLRIALLFGLGTSYGILVRHLHDDLQLAPFLIGAGKYMGLWGIAGVGLGTLLPWMDTLWEEETDSHSEILRRERNSLHVNRKPANEEKEMLGTEWTPVVRSMGAFIAVAFAIRKLHWASAMQASSTLFLVNPVLWYIIDRSKPGFVLSSSVGALGTALLITNSKCLPSMGSPPTNGTTEQLVIHTTLARDESVMSRKSLEGGIWILSVLFCSCVCFGNIGRRLALNRIMEQAFGRDKKRRTLI